MRPTATMILAATAMSAALTLGGCKGGEPEGGSETDTAELETEFETEFETEDDKTLYAIGVSVGMNLKSLDLTPAELEVVKAGIEDAATGVESRVPLQEYGPKIQALVQGRAKRKAEAEKGLSQEYLAQAAGEEGAEASSSGLIYFETRKGSGASPGATDRVRVHYRGTLRDGKQFDSSYDRNQPAEFPLNGVIPCWGEGLQKMAVGDKAKLICPSSIAYGDTGRPPTIPPGATLIFEVELIEIVGS